MLVSHIRSFDFRAANVEQILTESIFYLSNVTNAYQFQRNAKNANLETAGLSAKDFRLTLLESEYLTVNIKYAVLCCALYPLKRAEAYVRELLDAEDCDAVLQFMGSRAKRAAIRDAAAEWELTRADVVPSAMRKDKARFQEYLAKINPHIKNKVSKKRTFLLKAENIERHDFYGEILCKALCVYHRMIPTKMAEAHVTNRLRASCTTHALNMIESYTTVKRRRMHNDGSDGFGGSKFSLNCESENQTRVLPDMEFSYEDIGNPISSEAHERSFEQLSFDRFISRFNGRRRKA